LKGLTFSIAPKTLPIPRTKMYFQPTVIYKDPDELRNHCIIRYISRRVLTKNQNFICALTGPTGVGKSYSALSIAEMYSQATGIPFDPHIHILHNIKQLLELITDKERDKKIQRGTLLIFEEPQIEANARNWQSEINNIMSSLLSTFRNQNLVIFFTVPYLEFIDKQSRILFHARFEVLGFDKSSGLSTLKPRFLEYNPELDYFYRKRIIVRYKIPEKNYYGKEKMGKWLIPKASKEVIDVYEAIKKQFSVDLNAKLLSKIGKKQEGEDKPTKINIDGNTLREIYLNHGADYQKVLEIYPNINLMSLEKYFSIFKRAYGVWHPPVTA